jgi:hypothetical protein
MEESILITSIVNKFMPEFKKHIQLPCAVSDLPPLPLINSFNEAAHQFVYAPSKSEVGILAA